jgi:hypothetical protein
MSRAREEMEQDAEVTVAIKKTQKNLEKMKQSSKEILTTLDEENSLIDKQIADTERELRETPSDSPMMKLLQRRMERLRKQRMLNQSARVVSRDIAIIAEEQRLKIASEHSGSDGSDLSSGSGSPRSMSLSPPRRDSGSPHSDSDLSGSDSSVELGDLPSTPPQVLAERQRIARETALKQAEDSAPKKPVKSVISSKRPLPPPRRDEHTVPVLFSAAASGGKKTVPVVAPKKVVVDPLQAAFNLINGLPPVRESGMQLSPRTEYKVACRILEIAGDYRDEVDSATSLRIGAANKVVNSYLEKLKTPSARLVKLF